MIGRVNTGGGTGATLTVTAPVAEKKNIIGFPSDEIPNGTTQNGITFTVGDGYYEFNGTANDNLWLHIHVLGTDAPFDLNAEYSLSGAPEGGSINTFNLSVTNGLGVWKYDTGSGVTFQFSEIKEGSARVEIGIYEGTTLDHVVFRPQLVKRNSTVVTVSKDGKTKTKTAGTDGVVVFRRLATGQWTVTITDGEQTAQKTVTITADYSTSITFFSATIHVIYPAGSTCTVTDGVTTLTAPDTSGTWACVVPNKGLWTITAGEWSGEVDIAATGQEKTVRLAKWIVKNGVSTDIDLATQLISGRFPTVTQGAGYTAIRVTPSQSTGILSDKPVDMANVKTIIADVDIVKATIDSNSKFKGVILISTANKAYNSVGAAKEAIVGQNGSTSIGRQTLSVDAASTTESLYVGFALGGVITMNLYDLRVEV